MQFPTSRKDPDAEIGRFLYDCVSGIPRNLGFVLDKALDSSNGRKPTRSDLLIGVVKQAYRGGLEEKLFYLSSEEADRDGGNYVDLAELDRLDLLGELSKATEALFHAVMNDLPILGSATFGGAPRLSKYFRSSFVVDIERTEPRRQLIANIGYVFKRFGMWAI